MQGEYLDSGAPAPASTFREPLSEEETALERLLTRLYEGRKSARAAAARSLRDYGADAVRPLCAKLKDKDEEVRLEAATSLGLIGDQRAVEPLIAALRANCLGGSAQAQQRLGLRFIVWSVVFSIIGFLAVQALLGKVNGGFLGGCAGPVITWIIARSKRGKTLRVITRALERIAEANPIPEVRDALPELQILAGDAIQQDWKTRRVLRASLKRIDALTEDVRSLPIAARPPEPEVAMLPTPVYAATTEAEALPRVSP